MVSRIFLILSILLCQSQAATNVGGVLLQNTVWTSDGRANPYTLTRDVQIPIGVTLTIRAGVQVIFDNGDFEFSVKGALRIEGTAARSVQFSGGKSSDTKWMLTFQSTDLNRSSISHTVFTGPKRALQLNNAAVDLPQNSGVLVLEAIKCLSGTEITANGELFLFIAVTDMDDVVFLILFQVNIFAINTQIPLRWNCAQVLFRVQLWPVSTITGSQSV